MSLQYMVATKSANLTYLTELFYTVKCFWPFLDFQEKEFSISNSNATSPLNYMLQEQQNRP